MVSNFGVYLCKMKLKTSGSTYVSLTKNFTINDFCNHGIFQKFIFCSGSFNISIRIEVFSRRFYETLPCVFKHEKC